jgi:UrcA family protein
MTASMTKVIATSVLAMTLSGIASHARADGKKPDHGLTPAITVKFADLNTSTAEGISVLYSRIIQAADGVCGAEARWYPTQFWSQQECYRTTLDSVVARLNLPRLTALHLSTTHRKPVVAAVQ